jgi:hypothetical protein
MSFMCCFTKTDTAHIEVAHVPMFTTTLKASSYDTTLELGRSKRSNDY